MKNMQRYICLFFVAVLAIGNFSCKKDPQVNIDRIRIHENEKQFSTDGGTISMNLSGSVSYSKAISKMTLWVGSVQDFSDATGYEVQMQDTVFSVDVDNLKSDTVYYYRYGVYRYSVEFDKEMEIGGMQTDVMSTPNLSFMANVETGEVSQISQTSAVVAGTIINDGGSAIVEKGICWSMGHNPTITDSYATSGAGTGSYTVILEGLLANTQYYVRAYAVNNQGTSYGTEVSFYTSSDVSLPSVGDIVVKDITQTQATVTATVQGEGSTPVIERGCCWDTIPYPNIDGSHAVGGSGIGHFVCNLMGLSKGTTYYVRAYAVNSQGTSYSSQLSFITKADIPTVVTNQVANITQTTAQGRYRVTDDGGVNVTEHGICWSTTSNPTINNSHESNGAGTGFYTINMTGLTPNETYYVRGYARNNTGIGYGNVVSFVTKP